MVSCQFNRSFLRYFTDHDRGGVCDLLHGYSSFRYKSETCRLYQSFFLCQSDIDGLDIHFLLGSIMYQ